MLNPNSERKEDKELTEANLDQYFFIHTNKLILFGLSPRHEAITKHKSKEDEIIEVKFDTNRTQNISGKHKCKYSGYIARDWRFLLLAGAANLDMRSVICEICMRSGTTYKVRSFVKNAKLIEYNERILDKEGIQTLVEKPESDGFLAIIMLKTLELGGNAQSIEQLVEKNFHESDRLMSK